jgi:hypothetical protein
MEVIDIDGNIITNERKFLNRWQVDFQNLYSNSVNDDFFSFMIITIVQREKKQG